jgi:hypothetical protein
MTDLIDAATIAELTDLNVSAMKETFIITYVTQVDDGAGSYTETTTTEPTIGMLYGAPGDEMGADQIKARGRFRIEVPKTLTVPATARITRVRTGAVYAVKYPFIDTYDVSLILGVEDV